MKTHLGFSRGDQIFVSLLVAVFVVLSFCYWAKLSGLGQVPVEVERLASRRYDFRLDVNTATWVEWAQLAGIGEVLARRIVADREEHGPFGSIDDVRRVNGIGPKKLAVIREWLLIGSEEPAGVGNPAGVGDVVVP